MTILSPQISLLTQALARVRDGALGAAAFSTLARDQHALLDALPGPYATVLQQLLDRLESSALFSEESCSFSQRDLLDNLQLWLDKAQLQLDKAKT